MRDLGDHPGLFRPTWPAPANVAACITTRNGGFSDAPYSSYNLAYHVGDEPRVVARNRALLAHTLGVRQWQWLNQVHGTEVVRVSAVSEDDEVPSADAVVTAASGLALSVLTADCLPLLLCDRRGEEVAVAHAGWRGLAAGIIARVVAEFRAPPGELLVYLGPSIGAPHFEVDAPVWRAFAGAPGFGQASLAFSPTPEKPGHWQCDLAKLARLQLKWLGVQSVFGGDVCAFADARFYSHRRDGVTGRFATAIWRT